MKWLAINAFVLTSGKMTIKTYQILYLFSDHNMYYVKFDLRMMCIWGKRVIKKLNVMQYFNLAFFFSFIVFVFWCVKLSLQHCVFTETKLYIWIFFFGIKKQESAKIKQDKSCFFFYCHYRQTRVRADWLSCQCRLRITTRAAVKPLPIAKS